MKFMCVDPSIKALGYAVFEKSDRNVKLCRFDVYHPQKSEDWVKNAKESCDFVARVATAARVSSTYIEEPRHYSAGVGEAARNSGSILKLMFLIGMIVRACPPAFLVPVSVWKGNTPKEITQKRVQRTWGVSGDHNAIDAVGIGDYLTRRLWQLTPAQPSGCDR